ncbi:MAG: hypothetical protein LUG21_05650 [Clostridiales bacterium]|nr:hypothetical protein [Clostridiales bacterium]
MAACLHPICIPKKEYPFNKYTFDILTDEDQVMYTRLVPCGHCIECLRTKSKNWRIRLFEEYKSCSDAKFVTLTFSPESYEKLKQDVLNSPNVINRRLYDKSGSEPKYLGIVPHLCVKSRKFSLKHEYEYKPLIGKYLNQQIARLAIRRFLERYRKQYGVSLRHWLITDYGHRGTERLHLHGIVFNARCTTVRSRRTLIKFEEFTKIWSYGHTWLGWCTDRSINYITNYIAKIQESKVFVSPGLGKSFITEQVVRFYKETLSPWIHTQYMCGKHLLPRYYMIKLYKWYERLKIKHIYERSRRGRTWKNKIYDTFEEMLLQKYSDFGFLTV